MPAYKLGKHTPKLDSRTLKFGKYLTAKLPAPPQSVDYSKAVPSWPMMGNDNYGDCTCAAAGHMIEEWTANTGTEKTLSDQQILTAYNHFAKGNADAGANMLDVLNYWRKTGIGADKITAFAQLEPKNDIEVMDAVNLFGNCYIGVALPNFAVPPNTDFLTIPWVVPASGPTGNAAPNPQNGHCIPAVAYDSRNLYVVTWGALKSMSWQFYDAYADESFAVLSADWINAKTGLAGSGFNLAALMSDLADVVATPAAAAATAA
jgi:hypothetical protein